MRRLDPASTELTAEQEIDAWTRARNGDKTGAELLINSQLENAAMCARTFTRNRRVSLSDLIGEAHLALVDCVTAWDPTRSVRFGTYCEAAYRHAFIRFSRGEMAHQCQDIEESFPEGDPACPESIHDEHLDAAIDAMHDLPPLMRSVASMRIEGRTIKEICVALKIDEGMAKRASRMATYHMRRHPGVLALKELDDEE